MELATFAGEDGQTIFALSVTPPARPAEQAGDIVILFDTSASQTGMFRETALWPRSKRAVEAQSERSRATLRCRFGSAADVPTFLGRRQPGIEAAVRAFRNESPLGSTDMENVLRTAASKFDKDRPEGRCCFTSATVSAMRIYRRPIHSASSSMNYRAAHIP